MRTIRQFVLFSVYILANLIPMLVNSGERSNVLFRENDPESYIKGVSIIDGCFTAVETDLVIASPDPLILIRSYCSGNELEAANFGGWNIFPQCHLVIDQDSSGKQQAFTGDRSGSIFTYSGQGKDPLKIDVVEDNIGMVNTAGGKINGQTNHRNNRLYCKGRSCELVLGDGTKRLYYRTTEMPKDILGGTIPAHLATKILNRKYFHLVSEWLPSGNIISYSYDNGRISLVEIEDSGGEKLHASIRFEYEQRGDQYVVKVTTSDERTLEYHFDQINFSASPLFILRKVTGSHCISVSYEYEMKNSACNLKKIILPEGRFLAIEYDKNGQVETLKEPPALPGQTEIVQRFAYKEGFTDVFNAKDLKTRYLYDARHHLTCIEQYDITGELYRVDRKYWGSPEQDCGMLKSLTVADGKNRVYSQRVFEYDIEGNIQKESIYGNLTGQKPDVFLSLDENGKLLNKEQVEQHFKTYRYSKDGLNLLTEIEDCKGNLILFKYKVDTNLLIKKFVKSRDEEILKRKFFSYNDDGACTSILEDDGSKEDPEKLDDVTERHITVIEPKKNIPGVGLPERVEENALDIETKSLILVRKLVYSYFPQGQLRLTQVYDDKDTLIYALKKTYSSLGQVQSETDPEGRETFYNYDGLGVRREVAQILVVAKQQLQILLCNSTERCA